MTSDRAQLAAGQDFLDIAICICTRDRPRELAQALRSVCESSVPVSEVIVSDDGDRTVTKRVLQEVSPAACWVRGPRLGLGANRNCAVAATSSRYVLFLDDDAELSRDFIAVVRRCLSGQPASDRDRMIITGRERRDGHLIVAAEQDFLGYQRRAYSPGASLRTVVINSTVFPRSLFATVPFDPRLRYGYDEVDLTSRATRAGYKIVECSEAVNLHRRSSRHRAEYGSHVEASRLYVTAKRRLFTERHRVGGAAYLIIAPPHMIAYGLRRDGLRGGTAAFGAICTGLKALASYARHGRRKSDRRSR